MITNVTRPSSNPNIFARRLPALLLPVFLSLPSCTWPPAREPLVRESPPSLVRESPPSLVRESPPPLVRESPPPLVRESLLAPNPHPPLPARSSPIAPTDLPSRLAACRAGLHRMIPGDNVIEHLYFGWMTEPYARATLAIAQKTLQALEREDRLRQSGSGALADDQVEAALAWLENVSAGRLPEPVPGFRPDRIIIPAAKWLSADLDAQSGLPPALFAFADRATFTQADRWFGDVDLLTCAGFRLYPVGRNRLLRDDDLAALQAHTAALGIDLLDAPLAGAEVAPGRLSSAVSARLQPMTLRDLFAPAAADQALPALIDPPTGECWAGMIARRALYRGATGHSGPIAVGCVAPTGDPRTRLLRTRGAMWVAALDGQRLGIMEGWRDIRDGTATSYASEMSDPAYLEVVAHTALDILRHGDLIRRLQTRPELAITVGPTQLDTADDNAWSPGLLALADGLIARQIPFELRPEKPAANAPATPAGRSAPVLSLADGNVAAVLARAGEIAAAHRYSLEDTGGQPAGRVFLRQSADGKTLALVNLSDVNLTVIIKVISTRQTAQKYADALENGAFGAEIPLSAHQIRLLSVAN